MSERHFATAEAAEKAFYRAFEAADQGAMMAVWAADDNIACVHPGGELLQGRRVVEEGWRRILQHPGRMQFQVQPQSRSDGSDLAVHVVHEYITVEGESGPRPAVVVTNVYRRTDAGWRMVLHHASPMLRGGQEAGERTVH